MKIQTTKRYKVTVSRIAIIKKIALVKTWRNWPPHILLDIVENVVATFL